ncbi:MAG TPA: TonB-dependent receptor [Lacunisphaera sp.]|nr:TonB-dependent receptor [Lacunisphaera sp.]
MCLLPLLPIYGQTQQEAASVAIDLPAGVLKLDTFKVRGSGLSAGEAMGTEQTDLYDAQEIEDSGVFDLGEFFSQLPESPAGTEQLVLIDGKPTYMDISKLPPEMIASIEVANHGALPQYGAYANGRVINIRLKTSYRGESLSLSFRGAFAGDGLQRGFAISGAVTHNKLRFVYNIGYRSQQALMASDRSFSRNQDHTGRGGRDLRLLWGDTAVVQAVSGPLIGMVDTSGQPTSLALAPENQDGRGLAPADFISPRIFPPALEATAAGQRRFNTAEYRTLIAPSEELSGTFDLSRPFGGIEASLSGSVNDRESRRRLPPPVTALSGDTVVPAAYNPFGQDVQVGLVHAGFGPVRQQDESTSVQLGLNLNGKWGDSWRWNANVGGRWNRSTSQVSDLDRDKFAAALASADPAQRFNPFGDDPANAPLYPGLTIVRASASRAEDTRLDVSANGELLALPGGPLRLVTRGEFNDQLRIKTYENPAGSGVEDTRRRDNSQGVNVSLNAPWVGQANPRAWVRRFDTNLSGGYSSRSGTPGGSVNGRLGLMWSPHKSFSLRGNYAVAQRAPTRFVADAQRLAGETLIDPRRFPATTPDVQLIERDFDGDVRARSDQLVLGATVEPPFLTGFEMSVTYDQRQQRDLTSSVFKAQDLVYNELTFPGRVVRADPSEDDVLLGQPGRIVSIDTTPSAGAAQESSGLALTLRYRKRSKTQGNFHASATARRPLTRRYEVAPGVPFVFESNNDLNPPDWTLQSQLSWSRRNWRLSANFRFVDEVISGNFVQPATRQLNLQLGYRFARAVWGEWGRGLQVALSLGDLLNDEPPFADTLNGYRTGSALGRTYAVMLKLPLFPAKGRDSGAGREGRGGGMPHDED